MSHLLLLVPCYIIENLFFQGMVTGSFLIFQEANLDNLHTKVIVFVLEIIQIISYKLISNVALSNFKYIKCERLHYNNLNPINLFL
jgi:hypothetical protein